MKPGHGEVLLAEGDPDVREEEERLIEEFRRQLDEGMWAAVPDDRPRQRPARGRDGAGLRRHPGRRRAGDLLPARLRRLSGAAMLLALLALALIAARARHADARARAGRRRARRRAAKRGPRGGFDLPLYDPGRERRAEQRARELLRSCVNAEEWAMYRDLGFIRVVGRHRAATPTAPAPAPPTPT